MDKQNRKKLREAYRSRRAHGAVCAIRCRENGRVLLQSTADLDAYRNRFDFSVRMNSAPHMVLQRDWLAYGADSFGMEVLEELDQGENQTDAQFAEDIRLLEQMWREKFAPEILY